MSDSIEEKLERLLSKQLAEGLSDAEKKELNFLLLDSEEARNIYQKQCQLHSALLEEKDLLGAIKNETGPDNVIPMFKEKARSSDEKAVSKSSSWPNVVRALAACAVIGFCFYSIEFDNVSPEQSALQYSPNDRVTSERSTPQEAYDKVVHTLPISGSLNRPGDKVVALKDGDVRFNRDIRPILSDNCFYCHGPDKNTREADLRLDTPEGILADLGEGRKVIVPGKPELSEVFRRITTKEEDELMPPVDSHKHLSAADVQLIKKWIVDGATWEDHWAFTAIKKPVIPSVSETEWIKNPIDSFILNGLGEEGFVHSKEADKYTLIRRASFDLTGLPPTQAAIKAFLDDTSPEAYEKMLDRFLVSEKFGEHRARYWLDAARYSDTHGFHLDNYRSIWPYRDWVVKAYNDNMPFDQFTIEQIAGDMLPNSTQSQKIATGFNRCNPTTSEGGAIAEEYFSIYAKDRVEATSTVWLGLTTGCAACHDHKFDPITQGDFYRMSAFFRNTTQAAMDGNVHDTKPALLVFSDEGLRKQSQLKEQIAEIKKQINDLSKVESKAYAKWDKERIVSPGIPMLNEYLTMKVDVSDLNEKTEDRTWYDEKSNAVKINSDTSIEIGDVAKLDKLKPFSLSFWVYVPKARLKKDVTLFGRYDPAKRNQGWRVVFDRKGLMHLYLADDSMVKNTADLEFKNKLKPDSWNHVVYAYDGLPYYDSILNLGKAVKGYRNGKKEPVKGKARKVQLHRSVQTDRPFVIGTQRLKLGEARSAKVRAKDSGVLIKDIRLFDKVLFEDAVTQLNNAEKLSKLLASESELSEEQEKMKASYYYSQINEKGKGTQRDFIRFQNDLVQLEKSAPITLIMEEKKDSEPEAHILLRGEYDHLGDKVGAGVPEFLPDLPDGVKANRLSLANWLVDKNNPLPARVTINRYWQELFGRGIVKTSEDFGSQGETPTNLDLLDWLAAEFIESNWDVKHMYKLMMMSSTYRQSSVLTKDLVKRDPENRYLARGPRYRMDAEVIRDQVLYLTGMMIDKIGGSAVKPYQPIGIWKAVGYTGSNTANFRQDHGDKLYRRSLYTFWKRTAPPPTMSIFDAPSRESCSVRRERTNTPLQALVLMNDPQFVEAARNLAQVLLRQDEDRYELLLRKALGSPPESRMVEVLKDTYAQIFEIYKADVEAAKKLISVGESPVDTSLDPVELATWTMVANQVMNLDEFITKN